MSYRCINIMLGTACDMNCSYCLQRGKDVPANKKGDPAGFVQKLSAFLNGNRPEVISFWGGEPMLYLPTIHQLIDSCDADGITPTSRFLITTNGQRMSDEYVRYVNERNDVFTVVSSHGWEFSDEQLRRFFRLKNFSFAIIIHRENINFFHLRKRYYEYEDRFNRKPFFYLHHLRATEGCDEKYFMRKSDVDDLVRHLRSDVIPLAMEGDEWALALCRNMVREREKQLQKHDWAMCVRPDLLSVDLHGNVYACHHNFDASNITGNFYKRTIPIYKNPSNDPMRFAQSEECKNCPVFSECHGGCYLSKTHSIDCYMAKEMSLVYKECELVIKGGLL